MAFYAFSHQFIWFCAGAAFWGLGMSFSSGADSAMLYETLQYHHETHRYKQIQGNLFFTSRLSSVFASIVGGFLVSWSWRMPFYATMIPVILFFFLAFTLKETKHTHVIHETWKHLQTIFTESIVQNPRLRYFLLFVGITGFFSIDFWLKQNYLTFLGIPVVYFGLVVAGLNLVSGLGSYFAAQIESKISPRISLIFIALIPALVWFSFSIFDNYWMMLLFFVVPFLWGYSQPLFNDFVQKIVSADRRATIMSVMSFIRRGAFLIFAPLLGWITDVYSIQSAFLLMAILMMVLSGILFIFLRKVRLI